MEANERSGDDVVRAAETWLRGRDDGTWFLWVHLFDPHAPYAPPREDHARAHTALVAARSSWATDPARVGYAGDEHAADRAIGHLLRAARDAAGRRALLVAAVSDHGEGLGDHGESTHGFRLHDTTLRVPLLLSGGTLPAATVDQPVSTADLAPTLLALVGAPALPGRGASLLGRAPAGPPTGNASYSEATHPYLNCGWAPAWSLAVGRRRLVDAGRSRLYDTAAALDAPEQDLAASEPEVVADLFAQLLALGADAGPSARVHPSAATSAALGQLGYGGGGVARTDAPLLPGWRGEGLLDPDRGLELWQRMQTLLLRARSEGLQSAEIGRAAEALLEEDPGNPTFRMQVATLRMARGEYASAAALLALALELFESSVARGHLGTCLVKLGRSSEALQVFEAAVELHPGDVMNRIKYAVLLRNVGRSQDADHQFDRALERLARNHPQRATYERLRSSN